MKKLVVIGAVMVLVVSVWIVERPAAGGAVVASPYERAATFDHTGWSITCSSQPCPVPIIVPWTFRFDTLGVQYDAVITASFTYRTSRGLRISAQPNLADGGDAVPISFDSRPLAPATRQRSVTLTWLVPGLAGSQIYGLWISSTVLGSPPSSYDISFTNLTLDVEGAPS